ncbi:MAG: VCBS repeat-containing protein [Flavobacteriales bacterium]|nr:VCBS repeat-containing protein [Flavobacteriales bacterium]
MLAAVFTADVPAQLAFGPPVIIEQGYQQIPYVVADLDQDGDPDILTVSALDTLAQWWENDGSGTFLGPWVINSDPFPPGDISFYYDDFLQVYDVELDGDLDVIYAFRDQGMVYWHEHFGAGLFGPRILLNACTASRGPR